MQVHEATVLFSALAQETRLQALCLLVKAGKSGEAAGVLSEQLNVPATTLSFHLSQLAHSGLVKQQRSGRSIIYSANFILIKQLIAFLLQDCCLSDQKAVQ